MVFKEIIFMGGSTGRGNTGPVAEFNMQIDPEAAAIVMSSGLRVSMVLLLPRRTLELFSAL